MKATKVQLVAALERVAWTAGSMVASQVAGRRGGRRRGGDAPPTARHIFEALRSALPKDDYRRCLFAAKQTSNCLIHRPPPAPNWGCASEVGSKEVRSIWSL